MFTKLINAAAKCTCRDYFSSCCDCGGNGCGCSGCVTCNMCETCAEDDKD